MRKFTFFLFVLSVISVIGNSKQQTNKNVKTKSPNYSFNVPVKKQSYHISNKGKQSIMKYESCNLTAYWDSNGWSIGYGHHNQKDVHKGMKISKAKAVEFFNKDIIKTEESVKRLIEALPVKHNFSQSFIDGMCDLVYNCGENGVRTSEFYNRLTKCRKNNKLDINYAIAAVKNCRASLPGNKKRRIETSKLMLS